MKRTLYVIIEGEGGIPQDINHATFDEAEHRAKWLELIGKFVSDRMSDANFKLLSDEEIEAEYEPYMYSTGSIEYRQLEYEMELGTTFVFVDGGLVQDVWCNNGWDVFDFDGVNDDGDYCPICGHDPLPYVPINSRAAIRLMLKDLRRKPDSWRQIDRSLEHRICPKCRFDWDEEWDYDKVVNHRNAWREAREKEKIA